MAGGSADRDIQVTITLTNKNKKVDVYAPPVVDRPIVVTAQSIVAPRNLPVNVAATIPTPFPFYFYAILHSPHAWVAAVFASVITLIVFFVIGPMVHPVVAATLTVVAIFGAVIFTFTVANRMACETAIVIRKDSVGRTKVDEQKWWRFTEGRYWSDVWRWPLEDKRGLPTKRVIIIDAQEYDRDNPDKTKLRPFLPFLAPLPVRPAGLDPRMSFHAPSQAELGMTYALGKSVREWLDVRNPSSDLISMGILGLLIGGAFLMIFMGGDKVSATLKETRGESVNQQVEEAIQRRLNALQGQQPGQPPPISR